MAAIRKALKKILYFYTLLKTKNDISLKKALQRYAAALIMCSCLLFLTGVNFFIYSQTGNKYHIEQCNNGHSEHEIPAGEDSSDFGSNLSIQEEYVHEFHLQHEVILADNAVKYGMPADKKNSIVHYELIAPPPDL